jgi:hypothetical protein
MAKIKEEEEKVEESPKEKLLKRAAYSNDAMLKMVTLIFDPLEVATMKELGLTDEAHLLGLTRINSSLECHHWALSIMKEAGAKNLNRDTSVLDGRKWPLSKIYRISFLLARRSVDMRAFMMGVGLAGKQSIAESEAGEDEGEY